MKLKSILLCFSLMLNICFLTIIIISFFSKTSIISFFMPEDDNYYTVSAIVSVPDNSFVMFDVIDITLKPDQKAYYQYSVQKNKKQGNILINALYDPEIISVTQTGYGIEIHAIKEGFTLMQTFMNDGIKNIALITVNNHEN